jgi:uncharacterized protein
VNITLQGEACELLPERALYWANARTLFVADTHFGKTDAFRKLGIKIPTGPTEVTLNRLTAALAKTQAERLMILGDFWHDRESVTDTVLESITAWRQQHQKLEVEVILGNHDNFRHEMPTEWRFVVHRGAIQTGPFIAAHYPKAHDGGYVLAGHLHPGYLLRGRARQALTLPCFWLGDAVAVLPAIGDFTGLANIPCEAHDRVFVIADDEIMDVSGLGFA